jgi:UDP-2,4-diacetamido-2,4,6-trideoxy-beta-L-altropyranose hydrolase
MKGSSNPAIPVILRADGEDALGYGHIIRVLSFAALLGDAIKPTLVCRKIDAFILESAERISVPCFELNVNSVEEEIQWIANKVEGGGVVLLDGYDFDTAYQKILRNAGVFFFCMDDHQDRFYSAHAVIRLAESKDGTPPRRKLSSRYLKGLSYALLRKDCFEDSTMSTLKGRWLLIPGNGPHAKTLTNETLKALTLLKSKPAELHILQANPTAEIPTEISGIKIQSKHISNPDLWCDFLRQAEQIVCLASTVALEALVLKKSPVIVAFTPAQQALQQALHETTQVRIAQPNANSLLLAFSQQNSEPRNWYDANATRRQYLKLMNTGLIEQNFSLRRAEASDEALLLKWANHPDVRRNAIQTEQIPAENHHRWFQNRLKDPDTYLFIGIWNEQPVGQVRFDRHDSIYEIDYSVDETQRGKGFGEMLIRNGMEAIGISEEKDFRIVGLVRPENIASCEVFRKLGFVEENPEQRGGLILHRFVFRTNM